MDYFITTIKMEYMLRKIMIREFIDQAILLYGYVDDRLQEYNYIYPQNY
jgi:hypothetical protein